MEERDLVPFWLGQLRRLPTQIPTGAARQEPQHKGMTKAQKAEKIPTTAAVAAAAKGKEQQQQQQQSKGKSKEKAKAAAAAATLAKKIKVPKDRIKGK